MGATAMRATHLVDVLFDESSVGRCLVGPDGRVVRANDEWLRSTGLSQDAVRGANFIDLFPEARDDALEWQARARSGRCVEIPCFTRHVLGRKTWWEGSISPVEIGGGTGFLVLAREIPEQRAREAGTVAGSNDLEGENASAALRLLVNSVKDYAIFMLDSEGRVTTWNTGAQSIKGYRTDEIIGKHFSCFHTPEDVSRGKAAAELRAAATAGRFEEEGWRVGKDGSRFWANVLISRITDPSGQLVGFAKVTRDLTSRKREEHLAAEMERLAVTLRSIGDAVVATDKIGRVTVLNPVAEQLTGWPAQEAIGRPVEEVFNIVDEDTRKPAVSPVVRALRDGVVVRLANHTTLIARDGTERPISDSGAPIRELDGSTSGMVLVFRDQTAQRSAERVLQESERRYQLLFQNMQEGFAYCRMIFDEHGAPEDFVYLIANPKFETLTGLRDVVGKRVSEVIPRIRESHPALLETYGRVAKTGQAEKFEIDLRELGICLSVSVYGPLPGHFVAVFDNITERKRAEETLREQLALKDQLARIAESVPGVIHSFQLRPDGSACMPFTTTPVEDLFGVSQEVLAHDIAPWAANVHPDDLPRVNVAVREAANTLSRWHDTYRYIHPTKGQRWIEGWSIPRRDTDGSIVWYGFVTDVTDRWRAEEGRRESELRLSLHVQSTPAAVVEWDTALRVIAWNPAAEAIFGWSADEALGCHATFIVPEPDRELAGKALRRLLDDKRTDREVRHNITKDGRTVICEWVHTALVAANGQVVSAASMALDITERRRAELALTESEALYRSLFTLAPSGVVLLDEEGTILTFNDQACRQLGYTREEFSSLTLADINRPEHDQKDIRRQLNHVAEVGEDEFETSHRTKAGDIRSILVRSRLIHSGVPKHYLAVWQDISQRKRAEEALRESEERFRVMADGSPVILWVANALGENQFVNRTYREYYGATVDELEGDKWQNFLHPEDARRYIECRTSAAREQKPFRGEARVRNRDGEWRWVESYAQPRFTTTGEFLGHVGIAIDVTARRQMETALRASEAKFRSYIEQAPQALFVTDGRGRYIDCNPAASGMLGYDSAVLLSMSVLDIVDEAEREHVLHAFKTLVDTSRVEGEFRLRHADGRSVWASLRGVKVADDRFMAFCQDITPRKEAEEALRESEGRLRAIFDQAAVGVAQIDTLSGRFITINSRYCEIVGYTHEEMLACTWRDLTHPEDLQAELTSLSQMVASHESYSKETRYVRNDGSVVWVSMTVSPMWPEGAPPTSQISVVRDITEQRQLAEQLRIAQKLESIGRLAGGVAHDFNNLLTVIQLSTEELRQNAEAGLAADLGGIEQIRSATRRASDLTGQLLAFARKQTIAPVPLDLGNVVRGTEKMLRRVLAEDIDLVIALDPCLWSARCDAGQIEQVILNLAVNARDAMPGHGVLTIQTANVEVDAGLIASHPFMRPGPYVRLSVADTGHGMSAEVKAHIFEPFYTTKPVGQGTGLGLATVYGIVKQSEGYIVVDSEPGVGSTFALYFPRVAEAAAVAEPAAEVTTLAGTETVMVVEDDPMVRVVMVRALRAAGYVVLEAGDGREALDVGAREQGALHLLVTDVVMPGLDGRAMTEALRNCHPEVRVLYVSGHTEDVIARRGVLEPGIVFLQKPFTAPALLARVRAVLDSH